MDVFLSEQNKRVLMLEDMIANYDDGRSKSFSVLPPRCYPAYTIYGISRTIVLKRGGIDAYNDMEQPEDIRIGQSKLTAWDTVILPPHSVNILILGK